MSKKSKRFRWIPQDLKKIAKGSLIAAAGALLAWLQNVYIPSLELNPMVATAIGGVLTNAAVKLCSDTEYPNI